MQKSVTNAKKNLKINICKKKKYRKPKKNPIVFHNGSMIST